MRLQETEVESTTNMWNVCMDGDEDNKCILLTNAQSGSLKLLLLQLDYSPVCSCLYVCPLPCFCQFPSLSQCRDCWAIHPLWHLLKYWFLTKAPVWYTFYALSRFWFVYLQVHSKVMKQIKYLKLFSGNGGNAASLKAWINGSWHSLPEDKDFYPFLQNAIRLSWYPFGVWGGSLKNVVCTKHKPWKSPLLKSHSFIVQSLFVLF